MRDAGEDGGVEVEWEATRGEAGTLQTSIIRGWGSGLGWQGMRR